MKWIRPLSGLLFAFALCVRGQSPDGLEEGVPDPERIRYEQIARFTYALEQIHRRYVDAGGEVGYEELIDGAIEGMMSRLDPYSQVLEGESMRDLTEITSGRFGGVGVVINRMGNWITVISPMEGSPGWEAGLMAGDRLLEIDGVDARGIPMERAVTLLRGEPGSEVTLRLRRPEENRTFSVTLTRAVIENPSVDPHRLLGEGVALIRVKRFAEDTARLLRRELTALTHEEVEAVVLDLRGNPGGLLRAAVESAGLFLPRDSLVVYTQDREGARGEYRTGVDPHRLAPRLAVLVNGGTASAAEVLTGALQDAGRAEVLGETTFGKASVQTLVPMPDGTALKLTTAGYFTPSGRRIHQKGLTPDVEVGLTPMRWMALRADPENWRADPQVVRAVERLRETEPEAGNADSGD